MTWNPLKLLRSLWAALPVRVYPDRAWPRSCRYGRFEQQEGPGVSAVYERLFWAVYLRRVRGSRQVVRAYQRSLWKTRYRG
jgi:hypothetical protein